MGQRMERMAEGGGEGANGGLAGRALIVVVGIGGTGRPAQATWRFAGSKLWGSIHF